MSRRRPSPVDRIGIRKAYFNYPAPVWGWQEAEAIRAHKDGIVSRMKAPLTENIQLVN
jgi:hypothetical protein